MTNQRSVELAETAWHVLAEAQREHPVCCQWCLVCTRCNTACLPARLASVISALLKPND